MLRFLTLELAGKTGTAQNPHGRTIRHLWGLPHANDPKRLRLLCMSENAGFGAPYGVPIGSLVMEKYLTGKISLNPVNTWRNKC